MKKKISPHLTLLALAINAFAIGSTEFISVGLMPMIITQFHVTLAQAGLTVSLYALGVTIGAPLLTVFTGRWNRRTLMIAIMSLFIIGNLFTAFAPTFTILLLGRVIAALAHGIFMSVSTVIAANVVRPEKRASAIAMMFMGLTVATIVGVPLGTFIGQQSRWNSAFIFIALIGLLGLVFSALLIPRHLEIPGRVDLHGFKRIFSNKSIVVSFVITALGYGSTFAAYTYLSPILEHEFGFSEQAIVFILLGYGLTVALGNSLGGYWANRSVLKSLIKMFAALAFALLFMTLAIFNGNMWLGLISVLVLGFFAFMNVPGLQLYVVQLAEKEAPKDIALTSAFNISAFNVGIAFGSLVGAQVTQRIGVNLTPVSGMIITLLAMFLALGASKKEKRSKK